MATRSSSSINATNTENALSSAFAAQDLQSVKSALDGINVSAEGVSKSLGRTFSSAIAGGRSFNDTLTLVAASMSKVFANAVTPSLTQGFSSIIGGLFSGGNASASVAPFADGGIVSSPRFFGNGSSVGLMGERGAEAILPLARGPNGQLGIAASRAGNRAAPVTINITTPDAESFRRSQTQVAGALARAVARGQRAL